MSLSKEINVAKTSFRGAQTIFRAHHFPLKYPTFSTAVTLHRGHAAGGAVFEAMRYKLEGRGIEFRWCNWNFH
jgi:hypothetical protein